MPGTEKQIVARRQRIRRNQNRNKFPPPRRLYGLQPKLLDSIMRDVDSDILPKVICARYRMAKATLYRWGKRRRQDPSWMPCAPRMAMNRIFTQEEEVAIAAVIKADYIDKGLVFTDHEFRQLILT